MRNFKWEREDLRGHKKWHSNETNYNRLGNKIPAISITIPLDQTVSVDGIFDQGHVLSYPVSAPLHSHSHDTSQHTFLPADPQKVSLHHTPNRPQRKPLDIGPLASTLYRKIKELILKQSNAITSALMNLFNYILYWYEIFLRKLNCFAI